MQDLIKLVIVTPQVTLFQDAVAFIQVPAYDGYMGFLPGHAPFVSTLGTGILRCGSRDNPRTCFSISGGYFEIHDDEMIVLADVAERPDTIDVERAERARERAIRRLTGEDKGEWDLERARAALARALNRLQTHQNGH